MQTPIRKKVKTYRFGRSWSQHAPEMYRGTNRTYLQFLTSMSDPVLDAVKDIFITHHNL